MSDVDYRTRSTEAHTKLKGMGFGGGTLLETVAEVELWHDRVARLVQMVGAQDVAGLNDYVEALHLDGEFDADDALQMANAAIATGQPIGQSMARAVVAARFLHASVSKKHEATPEDLEAENERLREVLEWYASTDRYHLGMGDRPSEAEMDEGRLARAALNPEEV